MDDTITLAELLAAKRAVEETVFEGSVLYLTGREYDYFTRANGGPLPPQFINLGNERIPTS